MKPVIFVASCVLVLLAASGAPATIIIDSFDVGEQSLSVRDYAGYRERSNLVSGLSTLEVLGGSRDALLEWISGTSRTFVDVDLDGESGRLDFAQGPGAEARLTLIWDGDTTQGLNAYALAKDLTADGDTGLIAQIVSLDLPVMIRVEVYTDAGNASYFEGVMPGGSVGAQYAAFSDFVPLLGAGADFTNVGAIKFVVNGQDYSDADLSIDYLATGVPEPSTTALAAMGLAGIAMLAARRRQRRA